MERNKKNIHLLSTSKIALHTANRMTQVEKHLHFNTAFHKKHTQGFSVCTKKLLFGALDNISVAISK